MRLLIHDYAGHPFPVGLSRELARRGHKVVHSFASHLLTPRGTLERRPHDPPGLSFRPIAMSPEYPRVKYSFLSRRRLEAAYGRELLCALEELRPELVLSGQTPSAPQWTLVRRAGQLGIPVVTWVQDFYGLAVGRLANRRLPGIGWLAGKWYQRLDRRFLAASQRVVAITEDFTPLLSDHGVPQERINVIPNWAPLEEMPLRDRSNSWAIRHGLHSGFNFMYSGTLAMKHDPRMLVRLAVELTKIPDARLIVVSEGPGMEMLQLEKVRLGLDSLVLLPFQDFEDMPEVLASADVLVVLLEADAGVFSVPSKLLTYLCAGRPILASMPESNLAARTLRISQSGFTVAPGDAANFIALARRMAADAELRTRMGRCGRAYAQTHFDLPRIVDQFEAVFTTAMAAHHSRAVAPAGQD